MIDDYRTNKISDLVFGPQKNNFKKIKIIPVAFYIIVSHFQIRNK